MTTKPINIVDSIYKIISELNLHIENLFTQIECLQVEVDRYKTLYEKTLSTQSNVVQKYITNKEIQNIWDWSRYEA